MYWPGNEIKSLDAQDIAQLNKDFSESDKALGFEVSDHFVPFDQRNDIFSRAMWDDSISSKESDAFFQSYRMEFAPKRGEGFSQKDFALRNAAWSVSDIISNRDNGTGKRQGFQAPITDDTPVAPDKITIEDPAQQSVEIKRLARLFGADLVGITAVDPRWHYASRVDTRDMTAVPNPLPEGITHVVVMGHAMDSALVDTYPSALAGASTGLEYSHEAAIVIQLSSYIRNLGYGAVASMNDTALVVPYAIKAGLGEYGRNQMVITPKYGPRVRFSKIFTSLPLQSDRPKPLGIHQYCSVCTVCADACPPRALPQGPATDTPANQSTIVGVKKWTANCEKCFGYWARLKTDCAICMRVCPFNRGDSLLEKLWFRLATGNGTSRRIALWLHYKQGIRARLKPSAWWARLIKQ